MNVLIDLIGSSFIGGILLLLILKLNLYSQNTSISSDTELRLQQNAKTLAEILNYDLRKVGYNCDSTAIITADSTRIKFYADLNEPGTAGYGTMDVVEYFISSPSKASSTTNPNDVVLTRVLNGSDSLTGPSLGLVKLKFSYYDSGWTLTTNPENITYIKTELWVESLDPIDVNFGSQTGYPFTYWEMTINPRNI
ncbi:MAG TPA: hypothetical protein DHV28_03540 [Ignavibacteriales bacterium]|nr:hypothetical protein [Ignavibacteriales bacterium]